MFLVCLFLSGVQSSAPSLGLLRQLQIRTIILTILTPINIMMIMILIRIIMVMLLITLIIPILATIILMSIPIIGARSLGLLGQLLGLLLGLLQGLGLHPVSVIIFPSFRTQPLENLSVDSVKHGFLSNPAPGENLLSGNLVMETGPRESREPGLLDNNKTNNLVRVGSKHEIVIS